MWCNGLQGIYAQLMGGVDLPVDLPSLVYWYSRNLCSIDQDRSASRSAKFGVMVLKASMLD